MNYMMRLTLVLMSFAYCFHCAYNIGYKHAQGEYEPKLVAAEKDYIEKLEAVLKKRNE